MTRLGLRKITPTQTNQTGFTSSSFLANNRRLTLAICPAWLADSLGQACMDQSSGWNVKPLSSLCRVYWERRNLMKATLTVVVVCPLIQMWVSFVPQKSTRVHTCKAVHSSA